MGRALFRVVVLPMDMGSPSIQWLAIRRHGHGDVKPLPAHMALVG